MIVIDYGLYYLWCLFVYKILTMVCKRESIDTFDFFGIGALSLIVYMFLYTDNGGFIVI